METFLKLQGTDRQLRAYPKSLPLLVRIFWRGTWEKFYAHNSQDQRFAGQFTDKQSAARRKGRNCKWDECDIAAAQNTQIPGMYTSTY